MRTGLRTINTIGPRKDHRSARKLRTVHCGVIALDGNCRRQRVSPGRRGFGPGEVGNLPLALSGSRFLLSRVSGLVQTDDKIESTPFAEQWRGRKIKSNDRCTADRIAPFLPKSGAPEDRTPAPSPLIPASH